MSEPKSLAVCKRYDGLQTEGRSAFVSSVNCMSPIFLGTMNMIHGLSYSVNIFTMIKLVKGKYDISNIRTTTASIDPKAEKSVFWCAHANSAINPWLYLTLSGNIKSAFSKMIGEDFRRETKCRSQRASRYAKDTMDCKQKEEAPL